MENNNSVYLQLGDIIQIDSPSNPDLNEHNFFIDYIDSRKIKMIDELSGDTVTLNINEDGNLTDESISAISILDRPENIGYARQNGLLPDTFISIYFGGDLPYTVTGKITDLEEDMIEIKISDSEDIIYIDFQGKGIPEDIPIDKIVIRPPPTIVDADTSQQEIVQEEITEDINDDDNLETSETVVQINTEDIRAKIKDILLDADQIEFGPSIGDITQIEEVSEERKRYSIDTQVNDLLDELLSSVPSNERTRKVINSIHMEINRFKQLREKFSIFDDNGNATVPLKKLATYKPLIKKLQQLNQNLYWLIPIAQNMKKLYIDDTMSDQLDEIDSIKLTMADVLSEQYNLKESYKNNTDNYTNYFRKLNPLLTPFESTEYNDTITMQQVNSNIDAVIDNLGDFYSSVFSLGDIKTKKFLFSKYNLGIKKLQTTYVTSTVLKTKSVPLTNNDVISIKAYMSLPIPAVSFSNVNLPSTTIFDKSNLNMNYISYWKIFRENLKLKTNYINDIDTPINFDENKYLKNTTQYLLSENNNDPEKYEKYLNCIIPKTRMLFNLIKKYIDGKLSMVSVVNYLQPFLIYIDDLTFKQYEEINSFIETKILDYTKDYLKSKDNFSILSDPERKFSFQYESMLYKILKGRKDLAGLIFDQYAFDVNYKYKGNVSKDNILSNSEILTKMMREDYTDLYCSGLSLLNTDLFSPFDFDELFNQKEDEFNKNLQKESIQNECKNYVLTKRYIDITDLIEDNGDVVYFDKKYDSTVYDIIEEYQMEQESMDQKTFFNFLTDKLISTIGLNKQDAKYEAKSMIEGKREVINDQYAVLEMDKIDSVTYYYYKRENNEWIRDESIPENTFFGSSDLFCNIQKKCINIDNTCADDTYASELVRKDLLKQMGEEFDSTYDTDLKKYKKKLTTKFKSSFIRLKKIRKINNILLFKYELKNLAMGQLIEDDIEIVESPYLKPRDAIIGQSDIIKRNTDIVRFSNEVTRPAIESDDESKYWLYCIDSNTKLLPTFMFTLASVFVLNGNYQETLNIIKKEQGVNIDNITWCKYTGYAIEKIALDNEEEFEESGYQMVSRAIMESDAGSALLQSANIDLSKQQYSDPKSKLINNVITVMSQKMGININTQRDSIIDHVLLALDQTVDSPDVFEKKMATRKKKQTFEDVFNTSLLTFTLAYLSLFISVSIPSIQSKKTFPNCKKSFHGYPITGEEDLTNIDYISCIAVSIDNKSYPWKAIPKNKDKIKISIRKTLDAFVLKQTEIQALIEQKKIYLQQTDDNFIPVELDIKRWANYLPPLNKIVQKTPSNLSNEFKTQLKENIKSGSKKQLQQLDTIQIKIVNYSMEIIKAINNIVDKEQFLLSNNSNTPFLQNACCNTGDYITIDYFANKDKNIVIYNDIVNYLYNISFDANNMSEAAILYDPASSRIQFPPLSNEFSEDTIYLAFIEYCNFNNLIPINQKLLPICINKPVGFNKNFSIAEKIDILKKEDRTINKESFTLLINEVNKMNTINLDLIHRDVSCIQQMRDILNYMYESNNILGNDFLELFKSVLDSYNISANNESDTRQLKNLIANKNEELMSNIKNFINKFSNETVREQKKILECIDGIMDFNEIGNNFYTSKEDDTLFKAILFVKNAIDSFINVYPNIIINKVNYKDIQIPDHWKLSDKHKIDVVTFIEKIYKPLNKYYSMNELVPFFTTFQSNMKDVNILIQLTNLFASVININNEEVKSILDYSLIKPIFKFYFLFMINNLITTTSDLTLIANEPLNKKDEVDIISTNLEVEEELTGEITEIDIVLGEQKIIQENIAGVIYAMTKIICNEKNEINVNSAMIKEKVNRKKDKERHKITTQLRDMDKESRQIEDLFKNHRLERWGKGQQKGLTQYVKKTYDEEREDREKDKIFERMMEERQLLGEAMTADAEIMRIEEDDRMNSENIINEEINSLNELPNDDEYENDEIDDGYALQYDDYDE